MDGEQLEGARALIDFARSHAEEVFGKEGEDSGASENIAYILDAAKAVEGYLGAE